MDQEQAKILFEKGAIFILINFPTGSEFGIDYLSWTVGEKFRGVKMIPEGIHFIYYRVVSSDGEPGPRSGFFYNFSAKEVVVRQWDKHLEDINTNDIPSEELQRFHDIDNMQQMDKFLGPYPYEKYKQWVSLTSHIHQDTVDLLQPKCGYIYSMSQFESQGSTSQSRKADMMEVSSSTDSQERPGVDEKEVSLLPHMKSVEGTTITYSDITKKKYPEGASPAEITKYSLDSSYTLDSLLKERFQDENQKILGEIQFAFICFLIGQNYESFEQWKKLVNLMCTCSLAIVKYPKMFSDFISMMHFQINEIPSDFFVDIVTSQNFLTSTLHELFENILGDECEDGIDPKLKKRAAGFRKHLTEKFKWDFTTEADDCTPVIVDI